MFFSEAVAVATTVRHNDRDVIVVSHPDGGTRLHEGLSPGDSIKSVPLEADNEAIDASSHARIVIERADGKIEPLMTVPHKIAARHAQAVAAGILRHSGGTGWPVWKVAAVVVALVWGVTAVTGMFKAPAAPAGLSAGPPIPVAPPNWIARPGLATDPLPSAPTSSVQQGQEIPSVSTSDALPQEGSSCLM